MRASTLRNDIRTYEQNNIKKQFSYLYSFCKSRIKENMYKRSCSFLTPVFDVKIINKVLDVLREEGFNIHVISQREFTVTW